MDCFSVNIIFKIWLRPALRGLLNKLKMEIETFIICEICRGEFHEEHIVGCCNNFGCKIDNMCSDCATWSETIDEYICPKCQ